ncbi:MAG: tetratricopeptide repeat protein, partial [Candidatus Hydrogenedentes bacterium]|nr:tetratricopeptide repeat protein [Candidatus Hydrogenedentota bacterium]
PPLEFPTVLPGVFDDKSHHFHEPGTPGAQCVNCHMPDRVYMGIDARRDHSFRVPRPDLSVALGTPNACNQCHADKDAAWAAKATVQWYGEKMPEATKHFATVIAVGRRGEAAAESELAALAGDENVAAIVRATALELLQNYGGAVASEALLTGLKDPSPQVRGQAVDGMDRLPAEARGVVLGPLVMDPMASVRIGAARLLAGVPGLSEEGKVDLATAVEEYTALQWATADQPEAHLNLALLYAAEGKMAAAEAAYRMAIERDGQFIPARVNLANLLNAQGRNGEAEHLLLEAIGLAPREGELHYSMGLLLAESSRLAEAVVYMKQATELMPLRGRVFYNYALLLQHLEKRPAAEAALLRAHELSPGDGSVLQALVIFYSQGERWAEAKSHAQALLALEPDNPQLQAWVGSLKFEE